MRIAILDDYQGAVARLACFERLAALDVTVFRDTVTDLDALAARLAPFDGVVLIRERTALSAALLARLPRLRLISQLGKVGNHLDLAACTAAGVAVAEGVGSPIPTAELCWALVLAASRRLVPYVRDLRRGAWQSPDEPRLGRAVHGRVLGVFGYGRIGKLVAGYGRAFGMRVQVFGSARAAAAAASDGLEFVADRARFFATSDVLTLHLRLVDATRGIVTAADLGRMAPDALFVNTARAELVVPGALVAALDAGRPGAAALDVFDAEPTSAAREPLLQRSNVLCTPHLGYVEQDNYERAFAAAFENVVAFAAGRPQNIANPAAVQS